MYEYEYNYRNLFIKIVEVVSHPCTYMSEKQPLRFMLNLHHIKYNTKYIIYDIETEDKMIYIIK